MVRPKTRPPTLVNLQHNVCRLTHSEAQEVAGDGSFVEVAFDTELEDNGRFLEDGIITIPQDGKYDVHVQGSFDAAAAPGQFGLMIIRQRDEVDTTLAIVAVSNAADDNPSLQAEARSAPCEQGDKILVYAFQWSGAPVNLNAGAELSPLIIIRRVG